MAESKAEQIVAALRTTLAAITGDSGATYWYTVNACVRAAAWENSCLDETLAADATIYVLVPDTRETIRHTIGGAATGHKRSILNVDLVLAHRYTLSDKPHVSETPKRWTVQERVLRDALKAIEADESLGGLALCIDTPTASMAADETWIEGWAVVFQRLAIMYDYTAGTP